MTDARAALVERFRGRGGRGDRSSLASWFFDVDRMLLGLAFFLIAVGLVAVAAASPATAVRYSGGTHHLAPLHYFWRQLMWVGVSVPVMLGVSMMPVATARRFALVGAVVFFALLAVTPFAGVVVNGARRWIGVGVAQFQPSEFLKPFFIVATAWLLSLKGKDDELPVVPITLGMTGAVAALLMMQPDFGQTIIFCTVWFALLAIAGTSPKVLGGLAACAPLGLGAAYLFYGTARARIDAFLFPGVEGEGAGDHFQTEAAHATLTAGGWTGTGPGGGHAKFGLPEAHTDYIFSVVGEEFGLIACMVIAVLFLAVVVRVFVKLLDEQDEFKLLAASGLAVQFGAQALVSMAVNTGLAPSKGMTLPFISYGGSSLIALSIGMGLLLAFTRRNPFLTRSPYVVKWGQGVSRAKHYVLAAGGTGGHMVPAAALATELTRRGHRVALVSDARGVKFPGLFEGIQTHVLPAGRFQVKRPLGWLPAARQMWAGRAMARELYRTFQPAAVVGFGGYPALPALLAAFADGIPTAVHEQNAVLGRVNRLVARRVDAIATSYDTTERLPARLNPKVHAVGNPVREAVLGLRTKPYPLLEEDGIFRVLVTGGSQGASVLSQVVPDGLAMLPVTFRRRLQVTHQARIEDIDAARASYARHEIPADLATYLPDLPEQLGWAHLVIARAGASTIAELTAAGRPAILVPLPGATDDHQTANAREITAAGGARTIPQGQFTAKELAKQMQKLGLDPAALENAAGRAKSVGRPKAVSDLADLVESLDAPLSRLPVVAAQKPREAFA